MLLLLSRIVKNFHNEEVGATAVEYAIMLALIAVVCMQVIAVNGFEVLRWFENINSDMDAAGIN